MNRSRWGLAALLALSTSHAAEPLALYSGYTVISERPIATDLAQTVYLGVTGRNVLEGLEQILAGTGYRLADAVAADPEIGRLYGQPYPEHQRQIGPAELGVVLERLAGPAWELVVDPVNRRVSFEVRRPYREMPPLPAALPNQGLGIARGFKK